MSEPLLRPEEVASVLSGQAERLDEAAAATAPGQTYSLRKPVSFAAGDVPEARKRLELFASALAQTIRAELEADLSIELQGFQQEQAGVVVGSLPQPSWVLSFPEGKQGGLVLALDPTCALSLMELALGGAGSSSSAGREPTALESRVLNKLCAALSGPLGARTGATFRCGTFEMGHIPMEIAAPGETVGVGLLELKIAGTVRSGVLLATHSLLKEPSRLGPAVSSGARGPLTPRLGRVPATVRPVLRAGPVALSDLQSLEPGTVLRFEAAADSELFLMINNRHVLRGRIGREASGPVFRATWRRGRRKSERKGEKP